MFTEAKKAQFVQARNQVGRRFFPLLNPPFVCDGLMVQRISKNRTQIRYAMKLVVADVRSLSGFSPLAFVPRLSSHLLQFSSFSPPFLSSFFLSLKTVPSISVLPLWID